MTREEQISNGFTEMMRGFWNNQDLEVPNKVESKIDKSCSNCKYWLLDKDDENRKCKYCFEMDEWVAESEDKK